ncbi:MAG: substrate-binding domain-containing protein [Lachnospiraceae bacterium]
MKLKKLMCVMVTGVILTGSLTACGSSNSADSGTDAAASESAATSDSTDNSETDATEESNSDFDASESFSVVSREDGSGTRGAFVELFGVEEKDENGEKVDYTTDEANVTNNTEVMLTTVSNDTYAIGYASLGSLNDSVKAVKIDGAEPSVDTIKDGSYAIARPFNIATCGDVSETAQDFIDYILSGDGQKVIEDNGYIADTEAEAYKGSGASGKIVVAGSSSVTPVMEKLKEAYNKVNSDVDIEIQESDSTTGLTAAVDGNCDIAMASRDLQDSEKDSGLESTKIAMDGIAVIVNNGNPVEELSKDDVKNIFTGEYDTWDKVIK